MGTMPATIPGLAEYDAVHAMTNEPRSFKLFNAARGVTIRCGNLPHWFQPGATYFITFRCADSIPQALLRRWYGERSLWLRGHGIDPLDANWRAQLRADPGVEDAYHGKFTRQIMQYLDQGHGRCELAQPRPARIVADSLLHFDRQRYHLADFIIMPNHVHVLACLLGTVEIERQCRSWKAFSARQINGVLQRRGRFWQEESFDHLVRSPLQFSRFQAYIAENPIHAGLEPGQYLHRPLAM